MMPKTLPSWKAFFMHVEEVGGRKAKMEMRGSETNRFSARAIASCCTGLSSPQMSHSKEGS
jgi:hypothetical protein